MPYPHTCILYYIPCRCRLQFSSTECKYISAVTSYRTCVVSPCKTSIPCLISVQIPSNISVYGITLILKRELGSRILNIRIYQSKEREDKQKIASSMKRKDFGFLRTLPPDELEKLALFYNYDYPQMDWPLLMVNFSI